MPKLDTRSWTGLADTAPDHIHFESLVTGLGGQVRTALLEGAEVTLVVRGRSEEDATSMFAAALERGLVLDRRHSE